MDAKWPQNDTKNDPKDYFNLMTSDGIEKGFQMIVFYLPQNRDVYLIQYFEVQLLCHTAQAIVKLLTGIHHHTTYTMG